MGEGLGVGREVGEGEGLDTRTGTGEGESGGTYGSGMLVKCLGSEMFNLELHVATIIADNRSVFDCALGINCFDIQGYAMSPAVHDANGLCCTETLFPYGSVARNI